MCLRVCVCVLHVCMEGALQGLDSFESDSGGNSVVEHEQKDYARKAQASELTLVGWSRKGGLGSGIPSSQWSGAVGEARYDLSCRIDL